MAATMRAASVAPRATAQFAKLSMRSGKSASLAAPRVTATRGSVRLSVRAAGASVDAETGIKKMREGIKEASDENLLTPRFYTTDFDEMEQLFSTEINPNLDEAELVAILQEFREDFNQKHFVRNDSFKSAADGITGESRRIFIEFLERSCTAEFSGFLLYKELGRRLKKTAPVAAEIFTLMSRDEARHAGFLNKAMSDFNLALDLGFLTKNRQVSVALSLLLPRRVLLFFYVCSPARVSRVAAKAVGGGRKGGVDGDLISRKKRQAILFFFFVCGCHPSARFSFFFSLPFPLLLPRVPLSPSGEDWVS
jgi:hypothetical protein